MNYKSTKKMAGIQIIIILLLLSTLIAVTIESSSPTNSSPNDTSDSYKLTPTSNTLDSTQNCSQFKNLGCSSTELEPSQVKTPFGIIVNESQIHIVPSGTIVDLASLSSTPQDLQLPDIDSSTPQDLQLPDIDGWLEDAEYHDEEEEFSPFNGWWTVPVPPEESGSLIYLFIAVEPEEMNYILQPVLQYGNNGGWGGDYWTMASWYVGPGPEVVISEYENTTTSLSILGQLVQSSNPPSRWYICITDMDTQEYTSLIMDLEEELDENATWAFVSLEVGDVEYCSHLPGATLFNDLQLYSGSRLYPDWDEWILEGYEEWCALDVQIHNSTRITLHAED